MFVIVVVSVWGCTGGEGSGIGSGVSVDDAAVSVPVPVPLPVTAGGVSGPAARVVLRPSEGVAVRVGLGPGPGSGFVGEVFRQLLGELGFAVSDPAELVVASQSVAYLYLAEGEFDVWLDGRFPRDHVWLEGERFDGSRVGDSVVVLGRQHRADAVSGWVISKAFADEHGVYTVDALNRDPGAVAAFDAADALPGNGKADIVTVPQGYTAGDVLAAQAAFSGWDNISMVRPGIDEYFELEERFADAAARGVPAVTIASTPSRLVGMVRPGVDVYWLGVEDFLDDSNPLGHPQGELFSQWTRGLDGAGGHAPFDVDVCPAAAQDPQGLCPLGFVASTRAVAAHAGFAAANPAAVALLEAVFVPAADVSDAIVGLDDGADPVALASEWITANRVLIDEWFATARALNSRG